MWREGPFPLLVVAVICGCAPSAQEKYDAAVNDLERAEARLDNLRPAYDAAREQAILVVCKEIAGMTPEESAMAALTQLEGMADQAVAGQAADGPTSANATPGKEVASDADQVIGQLLAAHKNMQDQQTAMTGPIAKVYETMNNIKTPGTLEAKRLEEVFANMPEVEAYQRQEKRVERANKAVEDAETELAESDRASDNAK